MADLLGPRPDVPPPLDPDGVRTVSAGTALWLVATVVAVLVGATEVAATGVAGFVLGLLGVAYCLRLRRRRGAGDRG